MRLEWDIRLAHIHTHIQFLHGCLDFAALRPCRSLKWIVVEFNVREMKMMKTDNNWWANIKTERKMKRPTLPFIMVHGLWLSACETFGRHRFPVLVWRWLTKCAKERKTCKNKIRLEICLTRDWRNSIRQSEPILLTNWAKLRNTYTYKSWLDWLCSN